MPPTSRSRRFPLTRHTLRARRSRLLFAAALTASLAVLTACTGTNDTQQPEASDAVVSVTIGLTYVPDVQFAPFYVAAERGYYADSGLDVTLRHHGANEGLFTALEEGEEDFVVASGDEVLTQCAAGGDLTQLATLYATSPVVLISPASAGLTEPADLAGKTIGVPGEYGSTYLGLLLLLAQGGLDVSDVTVQSIGYTQTTALLTGQVDAVMGYLNGDAVRIEAGGMEVSTLAPAGLVSVGIAGPSRYTAEDSATATAVINATVRGVADVIADPAAAVDAAAQYIPGMTESARADAFAVLDATTGLLSTTGVTDIAAWDTMAQAMVEAGMIQDASGCDPAQ